VGNKMNRFKEKFFENISELMKKVGSNITEKSNTENDQILNGADDNIYEHVKKLMEITSDSKNENLASEKEFIKKYKTTKVEGKEIRLYENLEDGISSKRYLVPGIKEVVYTTGEGIKNKKFILFGYKKNSANTTGVPFSDSIKDSKLNIELSKTTRQGVTEEIKKGPLVDVEDNYKGSIERKETTYINGDRVIEEDKTLIDKRGNNQYVKEVFSHIGNEYINTKYLNGKSIFKLVKNKQGTNIIEFDEQGNIKHTYIYDKNGKPTEIISITENDGSISRIPKIYKGIPEIHDDKTILEQDGEYDISENYSNYMQTISKAGFSKPFADMLEEASPNYFIDKKEMEDFEKAKKQFEEKVKSNPVAKANPLVQIKEKVKEINVDKYKGNVEKHKENVEKFKENVEKFKEKVKIISVSEEEKTEKKLVDELQLRFEDKIKEKSVDELELRLEDKTKEKSDDKLVDKLEADSEEKYVIKLEKKYVKNTEKKLEENKDNER